MTKKKLKRFSTFIKDLVFNNPRADKQMPLEPNPKLKQKVLDNNMLYDNADP